jgi:hypothetical protein
MTTPTSDRAAHGDLIHIVTLRCRDAENAQRCLQALSAYGRPDAIAFGARAYEFGLELGTSATVRLVERWSRWADLDALLEQKVVPALPLYNEMLAQPFDPQRDTARIELAGS